MGSLEKQIADDCGIGFTLPDSFSSCNVEFASGTGTTKRSMGQFNGWDVLSKAIYLHAHWSMTAR